MNEYFMRGGEHPNPITEAYERHVVKLAQQAFQENPHFMAKGLRWTYNWLHFSGLWMTQNPQLIDYLYTVAPYPQCIEIETTTFCNFKCSFCEHTYWNEKPQHMSYDRFKYIIDQFPDLKWIGVAGIGQSYLNPDYPKMLDLCKSRGIYIEQYDNSYYLDSDRARHIVEIGLDKLLVSFDASTKETYDKVRAGSDWYRVIKNVKELDNWKKRLHSYWPEIYFHYVICKDNIHEVISNLELLNMMKIDVASVQFSRMLHNFRTEELFVEIPQTLQAEVMRKSEELQIPVNWNANVASCKPPQHTCTAWQMPFVFVDGTVISCCALNEQNDRPWQRTHSLGNVFEQDFRSIWYGEKYENLRQGLRNGTCPSGCSRCPIYEKPVACNRP